MKKNLTILLLLTLFSCTDTAKNEEANESLMDQSYFRHLRYLLNVKNETAQKYWPDFAKYDFYAPVVYYSRENAFVLNPNEHIRKITDGPQELTFNKVPVFKLPETYTDTSSLKFNNGMTSDSTSFAYMQAVEVREESLNRTKYAGFNDWKILYALKSKNAGRIETKANSLLHEYAFSVDYEHDGHWQDSYETYHCAYSKAKEFVEKAFQSENYEIKIEKNSPTEKYEFRNLKKL